MVALFYSVRHSRSFAKFNHPINLATFTIRGFSDFATFREESSVTPINILSLNCTSSYFPDLSEVREAGSTTRSPAQGF